MPDEVTVGLMGLDSWKTESLRITVFTETPVNPSEQDWWAEIVGGPPEVRLSKPAKGEHREEGEAGEGNLVLAIQPTRIDWNYVARRDPTAEEVRFWTDDFPKSLDFFMQLISKWLAKCPAPKRLAFGAVLLHPVENREEGYKTLIPYLQSVTIDPEGSSDFSYQINRPSVSSGGLKINRLSKWSVSSWETVNLAISEAGVQKMGATQPLIANRLELDINTAPLADGALLPEKLDQLFDELISLGKVIISKGDIP